MDYENMNKEDLIALLTSHDEQNQQLLWKIKE